MHDFRSIAHANERIHVHNKRNFPQASLDSEINARFLLGLVYVSDGSDRSGVVSGVGIGREF